MTFRIRSCALAAIAALGLAGLAAQPALAHTTGNDHHHSEKKKGNKKNGKKGKHGKKNGKHGKQRNKRGTGKGLQKVAIEFVGVAGKEPVACGRPIEGLGTTSQTAQLTDLRFYVSSVRLLRRGGGQVAVRLAADNQWRLSSGKHRVTLIDLENRKGGCADGTPGKNAYVRGTVPRGDYVGVRWRVDAPYALNHTDVTSAPAPLNLTAMAWSWQAGRKFAKIEIGDPGGGTPWGTKGFFVHLGSTGCSGDPAAGQTVGCALPNRAEISLGKFSPEKQKIAVDLKKLFAGVDVTNNGGGAPGCMSATTDPECPAIFRAFGMKLGTKGGKARQTVFRAIGR